MINVVRLITIIANIPTFVRMWFLSCIPGRIAREVKIPPISPPKCAIASIEDPIEKMKDIKTITPIMQARVDLTCPNLYNAVQLMIK